MRRTYNLSKQTIDVINGRSGDVAEEFGCDPSYISQILGKTETDPFAKFEWLYASCVRAGCDVSPWRTRLDAIDAKYAPKPTNLEVETTRFVKEASDVAIAAINDEPLEKQLQEVDQAINQGERERAALLHAINQRDSPTAHLTKAWRAK